MAVARAPVGLKRNGPGRKFWRNVMAEYEPSVAEMEILAMAAKALDTLDALETEMAGEPLVVAAARGTKVNPLLIELRHTRAAFARLTAQLGLEDEAPVSKSAAGRQLVRLRWNGARHAG